MCTFSKWRIVAVELNRDMPRRKDDLPHLYVGPTKVAVEERLADLLSGAGPTNLIGAYLHLRQDLLEKIEDFDNAKTAKAALRREKERLVSLGYALNGSG